MPSEFLPLRPEFKAEGLPISPSHYVGWVDAMGIQSAMTRSMDVAANFVFKLHITVLGSYDALADHQREKLRLYPVMDGVYLVASNQSALLRFLKRLFVSLAEEFVGTKSMRDRFLVRGALACGPVVQGHELPPEASELLTKSQDYRNSILVGLPMIQAYVAERAAPPFCLYVHESARAFAPAGTRRPVPDTWWRWFKTSPDDPAYGLALQLRDELNAYFRWCEERAAEIGYDAESIKRHRALAGQYFADLPKSASSSA